MLSSRCLRFFSYRPSSNLPFEDGRSLIMRNSSNFSSFRLFNVLSIGVPSLMLARIVAKYSILGTFNFVFSSFVLIGSVLLSKNWLGFSKSFVDEIYLMKSGKFIEIKTYALWNKKYRIKISDILNPEDNAQTKIKMQYFGTWIVETRKGESFFVMQDAEALHKDVLKHIFKGIDIDVRHDSDSDIIDI